MTDSARSTPTLAAEGEEITERREAAGAQGVHVDIDLTEDDDDDEHAVSRDLIRGELPDSYTNDRLEAAGVQGDHVDIDLTQDDDDDERAINRDLRPSELPELERQHRPAGHTTCDFANASCGTIYAGSRVELVDGTFFHIRDIMKAPTGEQYLNGIVMKRTWQVMDKNCINGQLHAVLPKQKNELCMIIKTVNGKPGSPLDDNSLVRISLGDVCSIRHVIITNDRFPRHSFREHGLSVDSSNYHEIEENASLVCRWKFIESIDVAAHKVTAFVLSPLDKSECDQGCGLPNLQRFTAFRSPAHNSHKSKTKPPRERQHYERQHHEGEKTYISADLFAGAGGATTGMITAGLDVKYVVDFDADACHTLQRNYEGRIRDVRHMDMRDFLAVIQGAQSDDEYMVDFLHVSYPCQAHSWLNRGQNRERDLEGISLCYSLREILLIVRPRVVTLEQTNGILTKEDGQHFRALIYDLTKTEYAVRWKVLNFAHYGNSQPRKRLIVMGACPGELLPPFPEPTHGPGLLPFVTIHDCIGQLTPESLFDNMGLGACPRTHAPYNPHTQLRGCITRSGGEGNMHPEGGRSFNCRELACLMTFPLYYQFAGGITAIKLQIGNAVPPVVMKAICEEVVRTLRKSDEEMAAWRPEVVDLEDEDEDEDEGDMAATRMKGARVGREGGAG
ncbi:hypothetical protein LTR91_011982 [Friedmanniomyces endolithicus]|uniref:DNA (cytosine-5-)-methyltransferase n=1 Tax=Friedmanniomyces endolithicus TaxID=329885 RepID=A0AAN6QR22_9PEZI|nr:hypothetical protein LTR94_006566 [Friedmanniomyces endolithicus]KAK0795178.1 hypothetical protein LTR59_007573 [Friedmanniomyces endolithicus]KAK0802056.1 hypothetical protein LTR38_006631 [Friedmanniomyces endolithicus]KAK0853692.1 hypothetical protein LTR03_002654 [Friedmanniomyces endolithicus]KAK0865861.1 hypothetical protein LTS02_005154 [Friedmanniomyces endolithicus]